MPDKQAILRLLGLALRAGQLQMGAGPVLRDLQSGRPCIVFLARDAGVDLARKVERASEKARIDRTSFDAGELARNFGRQKLAVVSIHEQGFMKGLDELMADAR